MNWRIGLSILLILAGGAFVLYVAIDTFGAIYTEPESIDEIDPEVFVRNAERAARILPLVNGGGLIFFGFALAAYEYAARRHGRGD